MTRWCAAVKYHWVTIYCVPSINRRLGRVQRKWRCARKSFNVRSSVTPVVRNSSPDGRPIRNAEIFARNFNKLIVICVHKNEKKHQRRASRCEPKRELFLCDAGETQRNGTSILRASERDACFKTKRTGSKFVGDHVTYKPDSAKLITKTAALERRRPSRVVRQTLASRLQFNCNP